MARVTCAYAEQSLQGCGVSMASTSGSEWMSPAAVSASDSDADRSLLLTDGTRRHGVPTSRAALHKERAAER